VRTPNVLMTIVAMYLLYKGVAKVFGRRAGLLGGVVLATMPDWFFLAHQTMTDMPFVAAMTAAMGLLLVGLNTDEEERVKIYELDAFGVKWKLSLWHLVFGAILLCALPQILYLLSRNIELVVFGDGPKGFRVHWDEFRSGSAGNCGLPGNEACVMHNPSSVPRGVGPNPDGVGNMLVRYFGGFEPSLQAIAWSFILGGLLWLNWGERRTRRLVYVGAWLCAAIATMAKGPAGFGLPIICAFAYVATKKRWSELLRLEMMSGALVILVVALPWYVAMYVRHGSPFTDRLIFHDMFNRAFSHVHDTNEGDDTGIRYYLWQLGYALFPWTGLAPLALVWGFRRSDSALAWIRSTLLGQGPEPVESERSERPGAAPGAAVGDASVMLVMWFVFAFALFTFMGTKFHHYIFPAVPPVAMLVGIVLDDMLGEGALVKKGTWPAYLGALGAAAALGSWGLSRLFTGSWTGIAKDAPEANWLVAVVVGGGALAVGGAAAWALRDREGEPEADPSPKVTADPTKSPYRGGGVTLEGGEDEETSRRRPHEQLMLAAAAVAGALLLAIVGRDLVIKPEGSDQPGAIRLLQLFTYNYRRGWPESLDFSAILGGVTIVAGVIALALAVKSARRHAVVAFCAFAFVWAVWGLDVYMVKTAPHWGQHEVIEAYYRDRKGPEEILVAYQMNWKGENFYTGNKIPAFVSSGANFTNWLKTQRETKGAKVMYFVTEHGRITGLRSEVGAKSYKEITDKTLCNKFVLVRAEL
jgi:4-amino-4-deoxy-L-arabinose transferase-like glycosyltransferase